MRFMKLSLLALIAGIVLAAAPAAHAQISVGVQIGPEPVCPYGYYNFAPYNCAPYGYYGPEWFNNGVFFGVGPWFHGPRGFHGHVDYRYDPRRGYNGPFPERNDARFNHFHGNGEMNERGEEFHGEQRMEEHHEEHRDDRH